MAHVAAKLMLQERTRRRRRYPASDVFQAIEALAQASQGLPRKLNRDAHYALSAAALARARQVSPEHVQTALDEFRP